MAKYKTYAFNQTVALTSSFTVNSSLNYSVNQAMMLKRDVSRTVQEDMANGQYSRFKRIGLKARKQGVKSGLTYPKCTSIISGLTPSVLGQYIPDYVKTVKYTYSKLSTFELAETELKTVYSYNYPSYYPSILNTETGTVDGPTVIVNDKPYYFEDVEAYQVMKPTGPTTSIPTGEWRLRLKYFIPIRKPNYNEGGRPVWVKSSYSLDLTTPYNDHIILRVTYTNTEGVTKDWFYDPETNEIPKINKILDKSSEKVFACYKVRDDKKPIWDVDKAGFEANRRALKRCNLDFESLVGSYNGDITYIKKPTKSEEEYQNDLKDVTDIFITHAVDVTDNDQRVMEYLYSLFYDLGTAITNKLYYSFDTYNVELTWDSIEFATHKGTKTKVRRYTCESGKTMIPNPSYGSSYGNYGPPFYESKNLILSHQVGANTYVTITVYNLKHSTVIDGHRINKELPEIKNLTKRTRKEIKSLQEALENSEEQSDDTHEFIIPVLPTICDKYMSLARRNELAIISLRVVYHTFKKVKKKWYQTKWFTFVRFVIYAVVIVVTAIYAPYSLAGVLKGIFTAEALLVLVLYIALKVIIRVICNVFDVSKRYENALNMIVDIIFSCVNPVVAGIGNFIWTAVTTGQITTDMAVNLLGSLAVGSVSTLGNSELAIMSKYTANMTARALLVATNPSTYQAIQDRDWCGVVISFLPILTANIQLGLEALGVLDNTSGIQETSTGNPIAEITGNTSAYRDVMNTVIQSTSMDIFGYITAIGGTASNAVKVVGAYNQGKYEEKFESLQKKTEDLNQKNKKLQKAQEYLYRDTTLSWLLVMQSNYSLLKPRSLIPMAI